VISLLLGVALAQDPAPQDPAAAPPSDDPYEIVVWGESVIRAKRKDVVRAFEAEGWTVRERRDGWFVFVPPAAWIGRARLSREGSLVLGKPIVAIAGVTTPPVEYSPEATLERTDQAAVVPAASFWILPSRRRIAAAHQKILEAVDPSLDAYLATIWATRFNEAIDALPGRLDRLWNEGLAFDGQTTLATKAERRAAVLDFWATRADTPEGEQTREAVAAWLDATVQASADPLTEAEIADAEKRAGRKLF
jgi:hypothetical protein